MRLTPLTIPPVFSSAEKQFCRQDNTDQCPAYLNRLKTRRSREPHAPSSFSARESDASASLTRPKQGANGKECWFFFFFNQCEHTSIRVWHFCYCKDGHKTYYVFRRTIQWFQCVLKDASALAYTTGAFVARSGVLACLASLSACAPQKRLLCRLHPGKHHPSCAHLCTRRTIH